MEQTNRESERSNKSDGSHNSHVSNALSEKRDIRETIRNIIRSHGLKHLFIFVSHPDSDHYNLIQNTGMSILPSELPVTIFLCGDWLNTEDLVEKVLFLRNLSKRPHTWIELPYYWNYRSSSSINIYDYQSLVNSFHQDISLENTQKYNIFLGRNFPNTNPHPFQGNLFELISTALSKNEHRLFVESKDKGSKSSAAEKKQKSERALTLYEHFGDFNIQEQQDNLENVYIHCMNQTLDNVNSQSAIISFEMPSLGMRFICTGDAHDETFHFIDLYSRKTQEKNTITDIIKNESILSNFHESLMNCKESWSIETCLQYALNSINEKMEAAPLTLSEEQKTRLKRYVKIFFELAKQGNIDKTNNPNTRFLKEVESKKRHQNFITLLVLPHHGSSGNISRKMLELFSPDLLIVSAGNGVLHGHPETETISAYRRAKANGLLSNDLLSKMKYEPDLPSCITYSDKKEAKLIGHLVLFSEELPLLSTNIHGTISFDKEGVYSDFSNVIEFQNATGETELLSINFRKRVEDPSLIQELNDLNGIVLKMNDFYFYKLISRGKSYYYNAVRLQDKSK